MSENTSKFLTINPLSDSYCLWMKVDFIESELHLILNYQWFSTLNKFRDYIIEILKLPNPSNAYNGYKDFYQYFHNKYKVTLKTLYNIYKKYCYKFFMENFSDYKNYLFTREKVTIGNRVYWKWGLNYSIAAKLYPCLSILSGFPDQKLLKHVIKYYSISPAGYEFFEVNVLIKKCTIFIKLKEFKITHLDILLKNNLEFCYPLSQNFNKRALEIIISNSSNMKVRDKLAAYLITNCKYVNNFVIKAENLFRYFYAWLVKNYCHSDFKIDLQTPLHYYFNIFLINNSTYFHIYINSKFFNKKGFIL